MLEDRLLNLSLTLFALPENLPVIVSNLIPSSSNVTGFAAPGLVDLGGNLTPELPELLKPPEELDEVARADEPEEDDDEDDTGTYLVGAPDDD